MTKYTKYLTMMLLAALAMTSCGDLNKGSVGDTTIYFSNESVEDGFSAGFVYVPIRLDAGTEANTGDVNVTVEVLDVQNATEDTDFMITSKDLVFRPGVDSVSVEIRVIPNVDEFDLKLGLASSNTNIDAQKKECNVHIEKNTRDRLCDTWTVSYSPSLGSQGDLSSSIGIEISWSIANSCFEAWITKGMGDPESIYAVSPFYFNFIKNNKGEEIMTVPTYKSLQGPIGLDQLFETQEAYEAFVKQYGVQEDWSVYLYQIVAIPTNNTNNPFTLPNADELELEYDVTSKTKTIRFADRSQTYCLGLGYELLDGDGRRKMSLFWGGTPIGNPVFTCK